MREGLSTDGSLVSRSEAALSILRHPRAVLDLSAPKVTSRLITMTCAPC